MFTKLSVWFIKPKVLSATAKNVGTWDTESSLEFENPIQNIEEAYLNTG